MSTIALVGPKADSLQSSDTYKRYMQAMLTLDTSHPCNDDLLAACVAKTTRMKAFWFWRNQMLLTQVSLYSAYLKSFGPAATGASKWAGMTRLKLHPFTTLSTHSRAPLGFLLYTRV